MKLKSNISSASKSFRQNQDANLAALAEVRAAAELAQLGGRREITRPPCGARQNVAP